MSGGGDCPTRYIERSREGGELAKGAELAMNKQAEHFWRSFLKRDVQDNLSVGNGPHVLLSSVLDLCTSGSIEEI